MIPPRLTIATLGALDMPTMRASYRGLGWPEVESSSDDFASFRLDGAVLALFPWDDLAPDARVPPAAHTEGFRGFTLAINVETPERVDDAVAELRNAGARITKEPEDATWGGRSAYFAHPEGNLREVVWAPGTFDAHGRFALA